MDDKHVQHVFTMQEICRWAVWLRSLSHSCRLACGDAIGGRQGAGVIQTTKIPAGLNPLTAGVAYIRVFIFY